MPEAFKGCLSSVSNLSDIALEDCISAISGLLDAIRIEERTSIGAKQQALSAVVNFLSLREDQTINEREIRRHQKELARCRQVLAEMVPLSQESEKTSERREDSNRLQGKINEIEELIRLRQSIREDVERSLLALSAIRIDSYLAVARIPAHDPLRLSLNGQGNDLSMASESSG